MAMHGYATVGEWIWGSINDYNADYKCTIESYLQFAKLLISSILYCVDYPISSAIYTVAIAALDDSQWQV